MSFGPPNRDSSWSYVILTDAKGVAISLPPRDRIGTAVISVPSEQKLDKKSAAGKKGATRTKQGAEAAEATIEYTFADHSWVEVEPGLDAIDPRGPAKGGPFLLSAPFLPPGFEYVIVARVDRGSAIFSRGVGKVRITVAETTFTPPGVGTGGSGSAGATGTQYTQALSEADIAQLQAERDVLLAQNGSLMVQGGSVWTTDAERTAAQEQLNRNAKRIAEIDRKLAQGLQFDPQAYSETSTPTKPESTAAPPGSTGKISDVQSDSYDPAKNPDAPKGGP